MFARFVKTHLRPDQFKLATETMNKEVIPLLRKQPGFKDEIAFYDDETKEAFAISFWENRKDLELYEKDVYPKVRTKMEQLYDETPLVRNYEVTNSTWYNIRAT